MMFNSENIHKKRSILPIILSSFIFILFSPVDAAKKKYEWTGVKKIVAVGDVHGAHDNFVKILKEFGIVDENLRWSGGKTHLVQMGDIMDKGNDAKKTLDLLMRLEEEAERAGGKVHVLLGNHEEMNITSIALTYPDYVTPEQFVSFLPEKYRQKKEREFLKKAGGDGQNPTNLDLSSNEELRKFWEHQLRDNDDAQRKYVENFNDKYGKWLLEKNAVIKINDVIFAHGGISPSFSTWKLEDINKTLHKELNFARLMLKHPDLQQQPFSWRIIYNPDGPLWYRGLALNLESEFSSEVDEILKNLGANYMVIAHTPQIGSPALGSEYMSRFMERIWIIDTGIYHFPGGILAALIIENGKFELKEVIDEDNDDMSSLKSQTNDQEEINFEEMENYLKTAEITYVDRESLSGRTAPWTIGLDDGTTERRGIFKHLNRPRPQMLPDSYKYDIAAYELSKLLDLMIVPPVIEREVEGITGSLQLFLLGCMKELERKRKNIDPPNPEGFQNALDEIKVFENLVRNESCLNPDDVFIHKEDWRVFRVDYSTAFTPAVEFVPGCSISRCSRKLYKNLLELDTELIKSKLQPYLNDQEIEALLQRKSLIIETLQKLIKEKGEESVLF